MLEGYHGNILRFLVALRHAGSEGRYYIRHRGLTADPIYTKYTPQFVCAALMHKQEIANEDHSVIDSFHKMIRTREQNTRNTGREDHFVYAKFLRHGRVVVILNDSLFEHGESRLLDPNRNIMSNIITENTAHRAIHAAILVAELDKAAGLLPEILNEYQETFGSMDNAVLLLFSHYIPCDIPFHECSRVLRDFVEITHWTLCVAYEAHHPNTNIKNAKRYLRHPNILVYHKKTFRNQLRRESRNLIFYRSEEIDLDNSEVTDDDEFSFISHSCIRRQFKRSRHRKIRNLNSLADCYDEDFFIQRG